MVKTVAAIGLLICGLALISAADPKELRVLQDIQRFKPLSSLGYEFLNFFRNATIADIVPSGRASEEDMLCLRDLTMFVMGVTAGDLWALRMIDSWGKYPSGILTGNLYDLGNFDECLNIKTDLTRGKYCFLSITPSQMLGIANPLAAAYKLSIATCLPSSCQAAHMNIFLKTILGMDTSVPIPGIGIADSTCQTIENEPWDGLTKATIVILSVMASAVALFTLIDYFLRRNPNDLPAVVRVFSARANSRVLFRVVENNSSPNVIDCLHGIRCMSLFWVIYGHEYVDSLITANLNLLDMYFWAAKPYASFIVHGFFPVDTFFVIGGMLVSLIILRQMDRSNGKLNVILMYLHRLIRIWPLMAIAILVYMTLMPLVADGPLFKNGYSGLSQCENGWYWSLIFVQNYATNKCIGHTWYLAVDMQLFIISPILLFSLYKWGKKAAAGIVVLVLLLSACLFATMMVNDYSMLLKQTSVDSMSSMYYATHTHAAPWLIGFLFGYFLHINQGRKFQIHWLIVGLGWILSLAMIFTSIFALYPAGKWSAPELSTLAESFYQTFTRLGWPLALCWVIFACMQGYGGLANSFLSSPLWQPISRLSYSIFIWHLFIVEVNARSVRTHVYFSDYQMMLKFWSDLGISILVSYVLYLIIEAPFCGLGDFLKPPAKDIHADVLDNKISTKSEDLKAASLEPTVESIISDSKDKISENMA
ncbi:hypothetical protein KR018_004097 [Drosophila ironensis]|nr:hypothetical protein KR018_004097 [Drosophila ironensis]